MIPFLIAITVVAVSLSVIMYLNNAKLKAENAKLKVENLNMQYELGKTMLNKDNELSQERVEEIKNNFKATQKIKPMKKATKEDVEKFYESQRKEDNKKDNNS